MDTVSHLEDIGARSVAIDMDIRSSPAFIAGSIPLPFLHIHDPSTYLLQISKLITRSLYIVLKKLPYTVGESGTTKRHRRCCQHLMHNVTEEKNQRVQLVEFRIEIPTSSTT